MTANMNRVPNVGEVAELMRRAFAASADPTALNPHYDSTSGKYDNLGDWLALRKDGLVYGVKVPLFAYSPVTTAIKTGANAGLVLEASTETAAGQNDYKGKALFECIRVNGGVGTDGMPYVTAIEGYDDRFDPKANNTYALTPVYYRKVTNDGSYITYEYTDTPRTGFTPCFGAYTSGGTLRPYILRACYMDSDGAFSSKSGTQPAGSAGSPTAVSHCANNDFSWSKTRASTDGLTFLTYGDVAYQMDFMQLMLGVKAPRTKAVGCVDYNLTYTVAAAETGVKRAIVTDAQAANIILGSSVSVGATGRAANDTVKCAKVLSKTALGNGNTAINLDLASNVDIASTDKLVTMPWRNGTCDGILGTFGARTTAALTNGKEPYRFQNIEYNLGIWEVLCDMFSICSDASGLPKHEWYVAPDVSACSSVNGSTGWTKLNTATTAATNNAWNYIKDQACERGARFPSNVGGSSTQGYCTAWHPGSAASASRELVVGGSLGGGAYAGAGCAASDHSLSGTGWGIGGRSSAIGHSAQAE